MLEKGWIRPSMSPYGAPLLFFARKQANCGYALTTEHYTAKLNWTYSLYLVLLTYLTAWVVLISFRRWTWRLHITKSALSKAKSTEQP